MTSISSESNIHGQSSRQPVLEEGNSQTISTVDSTTFNSSLQQQHSNFGVNSVYGLQPAFMTSSIDSNNTSIPITISHIARIWRSNFKEDFIESACKVNQSYIDRHPYGTAPLSLQQVFSLRHDLYIWYVYIMH